MGNSCGGDVLRAGRRGMFPRSRSMTSGKARRKGGKKKKKGSEKRGRGNGGIDAYGRRVQYRESMFF